MGTVEDGLMPRILKQAQVELDLLEIWLYTFNQWGEDKADDYLDDLGTAIELLANQPQMSRHAMNSNSRKNSPPCTSPDRLHSAGRWRASYSNTA